MVVLVWLLESWRVICPTAASGFAPFHSIPPSPCMYPRFQCQEPESLISLHSWASLYFATWVLPFFHKRLSRPGLILSNEGSASESGAPMPEVLLLSSSMSASDETVETPLREPILDFQRDRSILPLSLLYVGACQVSISQLGGDELLQR